jgi:hypothetical protein
MSVRGEWAEMAEMVSDGILNAFAVFGEYDEGSQDICPAAQVGARGFPQGRQGAAFGIAGVGTAPLGAIDTDAPRG